MIKSNPPLLALGFMTGTSMDGVDAAFLETDGVNIFHHGLSGQLALPRKLKKSIQSVLGQSERNENIDNLADDIADIHIELANIMIEKQGRKPDIIGFHGQTILHAPKAGITRQIGNAKRIAKALNIPVVYNFRENDMKRGGEGAPLAPFYHQALAKVIRQAHPHINDPIIFLNIGGVANISWLYGDQLLAGDCGPGNALMDDWVNKHGQGDFDVNGAISEKGVADESLVEKWLLHEFFASALPKSLDRDQFKTICEADLLQEKCNLQDSLASLNEFSVKAIVKAILQCPDWPKHIFVMGGGRHNRTLMNNLIKALHPYGDTKLHNIDEVSIQGRPLNGDFIEAEAFAFLAVRHVYDLPLSHPNTTGVKSPCTGGQLINPHPY